MAQKEFRIRGREWAYSWWNGRGQGPRAGQQGRGTNKGQAADKSRPGREVETGEANYSRRHRGSMHGQRQRAGRFSGEQAKQAEQRQAGPVKGNQAGR